MGEITCDTNVLGTDNGANARDDGRATANTARRDHFIGWTSFRLIWSDCHVTPDLHLERLGFGNLKNS